MSAESSEIAVIVTGGAGGLGGAMTLGLAKAGVRVAVAELAGRNSAVDALMREAKAQGLADRIAIVPCDVTKFSDCSAVIQTCIDRFGGVHGVVNNAAIGMQEFGPVLVGAHSKFYETDPTAWCRAIETNICGPYNMARAISPVLVKQGWGRIVNVTTSHHTMIMQGFSPYGPSKAGLEAATVIWAQDLADSGVTVNVLIPGGPANTRMIPEGEVDRTTLIQPGVMVAPVTWLMSRASDGVTSRRITAKVWDDKVAEATPAQVGAPAGWSA